MAQEALVPAALKLPLLCAKASPDSSVAIRTAIARTDADFFIFLILQCSKRL